MSYDDIDLYAFMTADSQGQRLTIGTSEDRDELQKSDEWIETDSPVEIRQ